MNNSWYGRFHYEMILWNQAHFALWDRWPLVDSSLAVYQENLAAAKKRAALQGYDGARFPKCTGPDGREWPHPIHAFLVWQQPNPIFFADLDYPTGYDEKAVKKWRPHAWRNFRVMQVIVLREEYRVLTKPMSQIVMNEHTVEEVG